MKIKKRTEIRTETKRLLLGYNRNAALVHCHHCSDTAKMFTPDTAALIFQIPTRAIYRAIEAGAIHFIETPQIYVCSHSLVEFFNLQTAANEAR